MYGDRTRFPLEALRKLLLGDFDRYGAAQERIAGAVYLAHAARANKGLDLVPAQMVAHRQLGDGRISQQVSRDLHRRALQQIPA